MKKFVMLTMAVALIAFFAMPKGASAAAPQIIFKGDYQVVGVASDNVSDRNDDASDSTAYVMQRFRLTHIAAMENVKGVIGLEIGWDEWGKNYSTQGSGTNLAQGGDTGIVAETNNTNIEVRMAYIEFNVPGIPLTVSAGKQFIWTHNQAVYAGAVAAPPALRFDYKIAPGTNLAVWWAKVAEGDINSPPSGTPGDTNGGLRGNSDSDSDLYVAEVSTKTDAFELGFYGSYNADHREKIYAINTMAGASSTDVFSKDDIYWTGGWAGFKAGPVKLGFDAIYSFGERDRSYEGLQDQDYKGYFLRADASLNLGGPVLDFMSAYASGDNDLDDDEINNFASVASSPRYPAISGIYPGPNLLYWGNGIAQEEYAQILLPTSGYSPYDGGNSLGRWFTNLSVTLPMDKLKFVAKYWYLMTAEKFPDASNYRDREMGHEIDLEAHYQLTPNLLVSVEGDYLFAGDYFKTSSSMEPDDAWKAAWAIKFVY